MSNSAANTTHSHLWPWQISLRHVLIGAAFIGLACVSLRNANDWWLATCYSVTIGILCLSMVFIVYSQRERRAFWVGFSIFGWAYILLVVLNVLSHWSDDGYPDSRWFVTVRISEILYEWIFPSPPYGDILTGVPVVGQLDEIPRISLRLVQRADKALDNGSVIMIRPGSHLFLSIANCYWTLLLAWMGGKLAQWAHWKNLRLQAEGAKAA